MTSTVGGPLTCTTGTFAKDIELEDFPDASLLSSNPSAPSNAQKESSTTWLKKRCFRQLFPNDPTQAANSPPLKNRKIDWTRAPSTNLKGDLAVSPVFFCNPPEDLGSIDLSQTLLGETSEKGQNTSPYPKDPLSFCAFIPLEDLVAKLPTPNLSSNEERDEKAPKINEPGFQGAL